jgi:MoaA/NifB/PqqE/SkfB family radical SAM enzyme
MRLKVVRWDITGTCNLKCKHCQAADYYYNKNNKINDLSTEEAITVIDKLASYGTESIGILGGEPLIRKDIIYLMSYIRDKGIKVVLNTNAMLVNRYDTKSIVDNIDNIVISIDGTNVKEHDLLRGNGSFEEVFKNIKLLNQFKGSKKIGVSYVLNKHNYKSTDKLYNFMKELDIDYCLVDVVHETGSAVNNWNDLALSEDEIVSSIKTLVSSWDFSGKIMLVPRMYTNLFRDKLQKVTGIRLNNKYVCDAPGITSLYILNDGKVVPTQFLSYLDNKNKFSSKSLVDYSLDEILNDNDFKKFIKLYDDRLWESYYKPCSTCKYSGKQCNPSPVAYYLDREIPIPICTYEFN